MDLGNVNLSKVVKILLSSLESILHYQQAMLMMFIVFIVLAIGTLVFGDSRSAGAFAIVAGLFLALQRFSYEKEMERSKFYLEEARKGVLAAYDLLKDNNNDRVTWILAARTLARSREISGNITHKDHKTVWAIDNDKYRVNFSSLLKPNSDGNSAFFCGCLRDTRPLEEVPDWQKEISEPKWIPEKVLKEIYNFGQYPPSYQDPVGSKFSEDDLNRMMTMFPSLFRYIKFVRENKLMTKVRVSSFDNSD